MPLSLAAATTLLSTAALSAATKIYESSHGGWTVRCTQDLITDRRACGVIGQAVGAGVLGPSQMSILLESVDKTRRPTIVVHVPLLYFQRGLTLRIDGAQSFDIACTSINGDNCLLQGSSRDVLLSAMTGGARLVVRAYGFPEVPHDFVFPLAGFGDAVEDFNAAAQRFL